jgi:hypothetical protein
MITINNNVQASIMTTKTLLRLMSSNWNKFSSRAILGHGSSNDSQTRSAFLNIPRLEEKSRTGGCQSKVNIENFISLCNLSFICMCRFCSGGHPGKKMHTSDVKFSFWIPLFSVLLNKFLFLRWLLIMISQLDIGKRVWSGVLCFGGVRFRWNYSR